MGVVGAGSCIVTVWSAPGCGCPDGISSCPTSGSDLTCGPSGPAIATNGPGGPMVAGELMAELLAWLAVCAGVLALAEAVRLATLFAAGSVDAARLATLFSVAVSGSSTTGDGATGAPNKLSWTMAACRDGEKKLYSGECSYRLTAKTTYTE